MKEASKQLDLSCYTLSGWRCSKARYDEGAYGGNGNKHKLANPKDQRILELEDESRVLKRANDILKDAVGFS